MDKDSFRLEVEKKLLRQNSEDISHKVFHIQSKLLNHPKIQSAQVISIYVGKENEVPTLDTIDMLLGIGITVLVPKVIGSEMIMIEIHDTKKFSKQGFGILEPYESKEYQGNIDCSVIPGVCYSVSGSRIGSGKGYYDKWLLKHPDTYTIGLCYDFQVYDELPQDEWDIPVKEIIFA